LFYSPLSKKAFREGLENQLSVIKNYVGTLEQKVLERTEQLNQAKNEAEYWRDKADQLVRTQLPEAIAQQMMTSKLQAEKIHGTIIFTDLANFTDFSRHLDPAEVNKHLIEHFTEMSKIITAHGGWVNKFLGDGILALFGLDDRDTYTTKAIAAAIEMQEKMADLPHLKMRVGVATGDFITGEFGTEELRRFDCLGHTVNLASRLQGFAEIGEILVCEDTKQAAADHFTFSEPKKITPKGIGEITIYTIKN
jgi:adenylate cyclase